MPYLIDSHAHLTSPSALPILDSLLERAKRSGIARIVNICTDHASLKEGLLLAQKHPGFIYNAAATTPHDVAVEGESFFPEVIKALPFLVALGETGLDYHYLHSDKKIQQTFLLRYFALALESNLPLIFHCREAFSDLFALADTHYKGAPGLLHCFTGTLEEAKQVIDRGWYLSISGIITFKKSTTLQEILPHLPLDRLVIETDTPYLAPQSKRGLPNEPAYLVETAEFIANYLEKPKELIQEVTSQNADKFFSFSKLKKIV